MSEISWETVQQTFEREGIEFWRGPVGAYVCQPGGITERDGLLVFESRSHAFIEERSGAFGVHALEATGFGGFVVFDKLEDLRTFVVRVLDETRQRGHLEGFVDDLSYSLDA